MWRSQSSVGEENNIQTGRTINIWPDSLAVNQANTKSFASLGKFSYGTISQDELLFVCRHLNFSTQLFFWPVKLLKTQKGRGRQVGWEDCKADLAWHSARGCKRFSRNPASKTQGSGFAEHKALWTPGGNETVHINAYFMKTMCHANRVCLVTRAEIIINEFLIYS